MPVAPIAVHEHARWRAAVTPRELFDLPIHRWFVFPHSYSPSLVEDLAQEWSQPKGVLLDPFVGAGTTVVTARGLGLHSVGFDLSPLAVFVSNVKANPPSRRAINQAWSRFLASSTGPTSAVREHNELLERAFDASTRSELLSLRGRLREKSLGSSRARAFLLLALLQVLPRFSRLVRKGGWLANQTAELASDDVGRVLADQVQLMTHDLAAANGWNGQRARVALGDARNISCDNGSVDSIITSPPYVNRHDYTRVFGVELAFAFLSPVETRALRYQSLHSHPEARPVRPTTDYVTPHELVVLVERVSECATDRRVPRMLGGYFEDLYCCLKEMRRVLRVGGRAALVVGNVRYSGIEIPVDELTAALAERAGFRMAEIRVARYRGNSAQQMRTFGRAPARESVVLLR